MDGIRSPAPTAFPRFWSHGAPFSAPPSRPRPTERDRHSRSGSSGTEAGLLAPNDWAVLQEEEEALAAPFSPTAGAEGCQGRPRFGLPSPEAEISPTCRVALSLEADARRPRPTATRSLRPSCRRRLFFLQAGLALSARTPTQTNGRACARVTGRRAVRVHDGKWKLTYCARVIPACTGTQILARKKGVDGVEGGSSPRDEAASRAAL